MADVFISYCHEDHAVAETLARELTSAGFSVWWDRHIQAGVKFTQEIRRQIDAAPAVIVLWSAESQDSDYVPDEAQHARDANKLIPVRIDATLPPLGFRQVQSLDLQGWRGDPRAASFQALLSSLRRFVNPAAETLASMANETSMPSRRISKKVLIAGGAIVVAVVVAFVLLQSHV